ncbi:MAG TPA: autotransporter-associated beta strand repeat-containing protein, partial [Opitutus sp.]|nr:autotransporter-associated beta strand repeat-containing protein [Opitutus sp.]
ISGPISNGTSGGSLGITKIDSGTLTLKGVDSFTGAIAVEGGTVELTANNVLRAYQPANGGVGNAVSVSTDATFAVSGGNNYTNTIGSVTGTGDVSIAASTILKVANGSDNTFDGRLTGEGLFEKTGAATFTFSSTANTSEFSFDGTVQVTNGTMEFQGGTALDALFIGELKTLANTTLFLNESFINVGTLNITGNTILDFGTGDPSILNADNIYIAEGAVLTIRNWSSEVDFLFANVAFRQIDGGGTLAGFNTDGTAPQNQVHFEGDPLSPDGSHTGWINYDYQGYTNWEIRPIPEPATYGAMLLGGCVALLGWRRYTTRRKRAG